jgi:hypothetical protein
MDMCASSKNPPGIRAVLAPRRIPNVAASPLVMSGRSIYITTSSPMNGTRFIAPHQLHARASRRRTLRGRALRHRRRHLRPPRACRPRRLDLAHRLGGLDVSRGHRERRSPHVKPARSRRDRHRTARSCWRSCPLTWLRRDTHRLVQSTYEARYRRPPRAVRWPLPRSR